MDIYSDQEAFQMYSCNGQNGSFPLKKSQGIGRNAKFPQRRDFYDDDDDSDDEDDDNSGYEVNDDSDKHPRTVPKYGCLVLEVQDWIDGINHPEWGRQHKQIFGPGGDPYVLNIRHKFKVEH
jgi:aldose 1-epimerase